MNTALIVEDEEVVAADIERALHHAGLKVIGRCTSGEEAVRAATEKHPDIILMDIHLAGRMDGISAAQRIQQTHRVPVIYLTAHADVVTIERAKQANPFGYVVKPFDRNDIVVAVEVAFLRYQQARTAEETISLLQRRYIDPSPQLPPTDKPVELGDGFAFVPHHEVLLQNGKELPLTKKERAFISLLVQHLGRTVPHRAIRAEVWADYPGADENTLRVFLWRLRTKIGVRLVRCSPGVGYRIDVASHS